MFDKLKEILINEIYEKLECARSINKEIEQLEKQQDNLKPPEIFTDFAPKNPSRNYNFLTKIIRRSKYKKEMEKYNLEKKEYDEKSNQHEIDYNNYYSNNEMIKNKIGELKKIYEEQKLSEVIDRYEKIKNAKNIKELDYTFDELIKLLNENNIPLVLSAKDEILENECEFKNLDDLVLVHKTKYMPSNNEIKTTSNSNASANRIIQIDDNTTIDVDIKLFRETIHFAVNGEVTSHEKGDFNNRKYAIIIPLKNVKNIKTFSPVDTYTLGNVDISGGYILCPKEEMEEAKTKNPKLNVIGYEGQDVMGYANVLITMLGYKYEDMDKHAWFNESDCKNVYDTILLNTNYKTETHAYSDNRKDEYFYDGAYQLIGIVDKLISEKKVVDAMDASKRLLKNPKLYLSDYTFTDDNYFNKLIEMLKEHNIFIPDYVINIYKNKDNFNYGFELNDELKNYSIEATEDDFYNWYYTTKIFLLYEVFNQVNGIINKENEMKHTI